MNRGIKIIAVLILLNAPAWLSAQYQLSGLVSDTALKPVKLVTIIARLSEKSAVVAYSISNELGKYEIVLPTPFDSILIEVGSLGFEVNLYWFKISGELKRGEKSFILVPAIIALKEVIVRAKNPGLIISNDTITFRADAFRDNTEKVTEDLLKKIPGLDVAKDGSISVNGKRIEKILIEGDDLFNKNYRLLSKNLSAYLIDKIQIIDCYTDNPILKGTINSENKVLNITLKNPGERFVFGSGSMGMGNDNRYDLAANLVCFYKKMKAFGFGNYNTIGKDPLPAISYNAGLEETFNDREAGEIPEKKLIETFRPVTGDFDRRRMNFNHAKLASLSFIYKPSGKIQIKGLGYFSGDKIDSRQIYHSRYQVSGSAIDINETSQDRQAPFISNGHLNLRYTPGKNEQFDYSFSAKYETSRTDATIISNNSRFADIGNDKSFLQQHKMTYINRLCKNNVLVIESRYSARSNQQGFAVQQYPAVKLPFTNSVLQNLYQSLSCPLQTLSVSVKNIVGMGVSNITVETGIVSKTTGIFSSLDSISNLNQKKLISDTFRNQISIKQINYFVTISNTKQLSGRLKLITEFSANYQSLQIDHHDGKVSRNKIRLPYLIPKLSVKWSKQNHNLSIAYSYNSSVPELADLSTGYILTDYRTFRRGAQLYRLSKSHAGLLNYTYADWSRQLLLYASLIHINDRGMLSNLYYLSENYDIVNRVGLSSRQQNSILSFGIDKFISFLFSSVKLKTSISKVHYHNNVNSTSDREINAWSANTQLSLRSALKGALNFHIGSAFNSWVTLVPDIHEQPSLKNSFFQNFLDLSLKVSKGWIAQFNAEHYYFRESRNSRKSWFFIDFTLQYDMPGRKFALSLSGQNLLNNDFFLAESITDFSTETQQFDLLPAFMLLGLNYRF